MKGFYQYKTASQQLLFFISISIVSFFIIGLLGTLALSAITGITMEQMSSLGTIDPHHPWLGFFIRGMQLVQFVGLFLIPSWLAAYLFTEKSGSNYLGFRKPSHIGFWVIGTMIILLALPLVQWLGEVNRTIQFPPEITEWIKAKENEANDTVKALLSLRSPKDLILNLIFVAGLAAVGEELLFRGVLQRIFVKQFNQAWPAIIFSAFLFAALHLQFYGFLPRFVLGILLGAVYWYSGSLWIPILAHFIYDALLITLVYFNPAMLNDEPVVGQQALFYSGIISALFVTMNLHWMIRNGNPVSDEQIEEEHGVQ
jgi:membrane protease YdiL (CAAX protease family)